MTQTAVNSPLATPVMNTMAPREFLSFRLGAQEYGVDLLKVQEIRSYQEPTRIANAPACVRGVLNLRGVIVPVIDLRTLLGMSNPRFDTVTVTVVVAIGPSATIATPLTGSTVATVEVKPTMSRFLLMLAAFSEPTEAAPVIVAVPPADPQSMLELERALQKAAGRYDKELDKDLQRIMALVMPTVLIIMAGLIGTMAYLMITSIFQTISNIH